ncbi:hypothetical protein EV560_111210 [Bosea sp. BK604]|nr:DUF6538 domain-containing protein [Bosea sp. BK604]TCR62222.1 hypothetical protein EV560_111210 [Bosea sp. BK604]
MIPLDLRPRFRRREITCSLRTSELHLAGLRARRLYLVAESLFEESRHDPMLTDDQLAAIVQDFYSYVLDLENKLRLRLGRNPEVVRARRAKHFRGVAQQARADLGANEFGTVAFISEAMLRKHKLAGQLVETGRNQLSQALMRDGIDLGEPPGPNNTARTPTALPGCVDLAGWQQERSEFDASRELSPEPSLLLRRGLYHPTE